MKNVYVYLIFYIFMAAHVVTSDGIDGRYQMTCITKLYIKNTQQNWSNVGTNQAEKQCLLTGWETTYENPTK